mgnify:FL=1
MGKIIRIKKDEQENTDTEVSKDIAKRFFETAGTKTNTELKPAYEIVFESCDIRNKPDFIMDGKVLNVNKLSKEESYLGMLGEGTCGLYKIDVENDKVMEYRIAEMDSDIEGTSDGKNRMILVFEEQLEEWVYEAIEKGMLYLSVV